ncbi:MAG: non-heme iron oxygenase ferredoxin subunit [Anaerolineae bacterium]|jgi:3-phenylpropionate/trans-cinnamate dioxygenase ferredoxin subunit|nr:non-heme iron oxygenase ferredoxin subunit [Anaerolineae bacterium]
MTEGTQFEYLKICSIEDVPAGGKLSIAVGDLGIVLVNCAGSFHAVADICTHDNGPLGDGELDGCELACPRHGARFDVRNGIATRLPAVTPIPIYPTRVVDGWIEIGIPEG